MPAIDLSILNQRQTPAFYADVFANRPAAGFVGRIFVSTNTFAFYRDNGTSWDLIGGPGTGTITGSGTAGTIPLWSGASTIGNSDLRQLSTEALILNSATNDWPSNFSEDPGRFLITDTTNNPFLILWGKSAFGSANESGSLALGNVTALGSTTFGGALLNGYIENGTNGAGALEIKTTNTAGTETLALTINSTQNTIFYNSIGINTPTPGAAIDVHSGVNVIQQLNQTVATNNSLLAFQNNNTGLWRIGSFYNAGANDFGIFDVIGSIQPLTVKKTTGQVLIGTSTVGSGKLVVASSTSDNGIQIVGANAPSLRIDSAESGPTKRAGFGISTATNNFIQGSADRDFCMFNGSTTASPILFGIYDTTNVQEAARISAARNFLIGSTTDSGEKLQVNGTTKLTGALSGTSNTFTGSGTLGVQLTINGSGAGFYQSALILRSAVTSDPELRALGTFTFNEGTDATWFMGNPYNDASRFVICRKAGTSFDASTSDLTNALITIPTTGNVLIGTTTDNGAKLQVNGSATFTSQITTQSPSVSASSIIANYSNGNQMFQLFELSSGADVELNLRNSSGTAVNRINTNGASFFNGGNVLIGTTTNGSSKLRIVGLPTSAAGLSSGDVYSNLGVLTIVP